jgi:hypothetical protein
MEDQKASAQLPLRNPIALGGCVFKFALESYNREFSDLNFLDFPFFYY